MRLPRAAGAAVRRPLGGALSCGISPAAQRHRRASGIVLIDKESRIRLVNAMTEQLFRCTQDEMLGQPPAVRQIGLYWLLLNQAATP